MAASADNLVRLNMSHWQERVDLAAAFQWTARLNLHEAVANHFSLSVNEDGTQFLMNPDKKHFSRIKASDLLLIDANDPSTMSGPNAPDETAWGLHGAIHRHCPACALRHACPFDFCNRIGKPCRFTPATDRSEHLHFLQPLCH